MKTIIVSIFSFRPSLWFWHTIIFDCVGEGAKVTKSLTESLARVLHPILIEKLGGLCSYEHWVGSFRDGFQSVFFCMLWNGREERESLHTRKKKDGNSRKAVWNSELGQSEFMLFPTRDKLDRTLSLSAKSLDDCQLNKLPMNTYNY